MNWKQLTKDTVQVSTRLTQHSKVNRMYNQCNSWTIETYRQH